MSTIHGQQIAADDLHLVYIVGTYPSLTMTFIDREIVSLRRSEASIQVISIRRPSGLLSPEQRALQQGVCYLLPASGLSVLAAHLHFARLRPSQYVGTLLYLITRRHPSLKARLKTLAHFGLGVYAAQRLRNIACDHIHAHFIDRAATLALVVGRLLGVPYSVTAHANDIYVSPVMLREKMANARFVVTCTKYNEAHLLSGLEKSGSGDHGDLIDRVCCIYHGLDLSGYRPEKADRSGVPILLAVGQLKEKKGFAHLLRACRVLKDRGYRFTCEIVGGGPLRERLEALLGELSLEDTVTLTGALPHQEVVARYRRSHVFVLPSVLAINGDRDGIPNVVLEAMAMELPVVSTRLSGIPEALEDEVDGLLVPPGDHIALADALARLLDDPKLREQLGKRARQTVVAEFDVQRNATRLLHKFAGSFPAPQEAGDPALAGQRGANP